MDSWTWTVHLRLLKSCMLLLSEQCEAAEQEVSRVGWLGGLLAGPDLLPPLGLRSA